MPRKSRSYDKHVPAPDPKYGSVKYAKFINYIMERGKKNVARKIFYDALDIVGEKIASMPTVAPSFAKASEGKPVAAKAVEAAPKGKSVTAKSTNPHPGPLPEGEGEKQKAQVHADTKQDKKLDGRAVF